MKRDEGQTWAHEVQGVLRCYQRAGELERHPARSWPAVQELQKRGMDVVTAIRSVVVDALSALSESHPQGVSLLRDHYQRGQPIERMAHEQMFDPSSLHRQRSRMIKELAVALCEANRKSARRHLAERFAPRQPVFGRDALVTFLSAQLSDPVAPPVVVLQGMGGLGKTTVAKQIAYQFAQNDVFTKVVWISAKEIEYDPWSGTCRTIQISALDIHALWRGLAAGLGIDAPADDGLLRETVRAYCARNPSLIILDNMEVVADAAALARLVEHLAGPSRILMTTRHRPIHILPPSLPRLYVTLDELDFETSCMLLRYAGVSFGVKPLAHASDAELAYIYLLAGGNPLMLWLIAGQSHALPLPVCLQTLMDYAAPPSKSCELYGYLYGDLWDLLGPEACSALVVLHEAGGKLDYSTFREVSELDPADFHRAIEELGNRMLVSYNGDYSLHRLTHTFLHAMGQQV